MPCALGEELDQCTQDAIAPVGCRVEGIRFSVASFAKFHMCPIFPATQNTKLLRSGACKTGSQSTESRGTPDCKRLHGQQQEHSCLPTPATRAFSRRYSSIDSRRIRAASACHYGELCTKTSNKNRQNRVRRGLTWCDKLNVTLVKLSHGQEDSQRCTYCVPASHSSRDVVNKMNLERCSESRG